MKKHRFTIYFTLVFALFVCCRKYPVDDKGLLITDNTLCFMSTFNLVGTDNQTVLVTQPSFANGLIDTVNLTVTAMARYGSNMAKLKPYCSVAADVTVEPKMGEWTDFSTPKQYTLISGNRKIRKNYTVTINVQR
jgi:hypothetical protein